MRKLLSTCMIVLAVVLPTASFAHPGNTDVFGCHTCWTNCSDWNLYYGQYHCHTPKSICSSAVEHANENSIAIVELGGKYGSKATCPLIPEYKKGNDFLIKTLTESRSDLRSRNICGTACIDYDCAIGVYQKSNEFMNKIWAIDCISSSASSQSTSYQTKQSSSAASLRSTTSSKIAVPKKQKTIAWPSRKKAVLKSQKCKYDQRGNCMCPPRYIQVSTECKLYDS